LDQITSAELSEWEAYDRLDPIGSRGDNMRMAIIASQMVNSFRAAYGKEGIEMTTPEDYIPRFAEEDEEPEVKKQSVDEMKAQLLAIAHTSFKRVDPSKEKRILKDK
jgi:hypothetical protein